MQHANAQLCVHWSQHPIVVYPVKHLKAESPHIFCNVAQLHGVEVKTKGLKLLGGHFMIREKWRL
jgi:hypothetical protein